MNFLKKIFKNPLGLASATHPKVFAGQPLEFTENARDFFSDPQKLRFDPSSGELRISPILKWYADDFGPNQAALLEAIAPYLPPGIAQPLRSRRNLRTSYLEYDWALNEQSPGSDEAPAPPLVPAAENENSEVQS